MFEHCKQRLMAVVLLLLGTLGFSLAAPSQAIAAPEATQAASNCTFTPPSNQTDSSIANQITNLINQQRSRAGLRPLAYHSGVSAAALGHSINMANKNIASHVIDGKGPDQRLRDKGVRFSAYGENIHHSWHFANGKPCWNTQDYAQEAVTWWMNSVGHRNNILNPNYNYAGVGVASIAREGKGYFYATQDFIQG